MRSPDELSPDPEASRRGRAARMVRRTVLDFTPLRISRDFRLLWFGELVSHTGRHIALVALPFQVFDLTGSPLAVGVIGLVQFVPLVLFQVNDVAGPAIGGLIIARFGLAWAYAIDAVTFLAAIAALLAMRPMPPDRESTRPPVLTAVREGFAYLKGRRVLVSTFLVDLDAMIFGMPRALFPVLAREAFGVGPAGLGLLYAAPGAGALVGALLTGWVRHVRHQGRAVLWAVTVWGLAIIGFGLSTDAFLLALGFLAVAGAADVISAIFRSTILQSSVPDSLRGRLSSIHIMVVVGGPRLGDLEAGVVAQLTSPVFSVISGGGACVAGEAA